MNNMHRALRRWLHATPGPRHENPLGLPRFRDGAAPQLPRRSQTPLQKRSIPRVKHVIAVASGKGGVGKSTVSVNLAFALASTNPRAKIGILDLDVFGPSIPKLMGLEDFGEPDLTKDGALVPLTNYNIPCMSMGFLLPPSASNDAPVVWRGLMVQKAVQQLLFDVDWRQRTGQQTLSVPDDATALDILVIDMPPGTGDVQLTLGQLVHLDGAIIVSTPQDVALLDARKGVHMFRKVGVPILGLLINSAYYICTSCRDKHYIFGMLDSAQRAARELGLARDPSLSNRAGDHGILGEIPLVGEVSRLGDSGRLGDLFSSSSNTTDAQLGEDLLEVRHVMDHVAKRLWRILAEEDVNVRELSQVGL